MWRGGRLEVTEGRCEDDGSTSSHLRIGRLRWGGGWGVTSVLLRWGRGGGRGGGASVELASGWWLQQGAVASRPEVLIEER